MQKVLNIGLGENTDLLFQSETSVCNELKLHAAISAAILGMGRCFPTTQNWPQALKSAAPSVPSAPRATCPPSGARGLTRDLGAD